MFLYVERKTWTIYIVYALETLGIAYYLKRVNDHAERRELSTSVFD